MNNIKKIFKNAPKPIIRKSIINLENKYKDFSNDQYPSNELLFFIIGFVFGINTKKCK